MKKSLAHLPKHKREELKQIVSIITENARVELMADRLALVHPSASLVPEPLASTTESSPSTLEVVSNLD